MCRIAGIFDPGCGSLEATVRRMTDAMRRGGPDDDGIWLDDRHPLVLGHRRLSIIDLTSAGHQPMVDDEAGLVIAFNGEIYNFRELRAELVAAGDVFRTASDTEVILRAYARWGEACFGKFNGMFALAILDRRNSRLLLARDHAGIKPLYYHLHGGRLYFASEIRAFRAAAAGFAEDPAWRARFLAFGHLPEPGTTLAGVQSLPRGHCLSVSLPDLAVRSSAFARFSHEPRDMDRTEATRLVRAALERAVERHLVSDAPIGLFLSGGVDSSALTLLAKPQAGTRLSTLSIAFAESRFSERPYQQMIAARTGARHVEYEVSRADFDAGMPEVLQAMDQPTIDGVNTWFVSGLARRAGLKAVLAGHGADELFGGYATFAYGPWYRRLATVPRLARWIADRSRDERLRKLAFVGIPGVAGEYLTYRGIFTPRWIAGWLGSTEREVAGLLADVPAPSFLGALPDGDRVSWIETNLYLQNQLLRDADFMSMWHGLEIRVPFLDRELMETLYAIPASLRFGGRPRKRLLIDAMGDDLPREIWDRPKQGFTFPFDEWMRDSAISAPQDSRESGLFDDFRAGRLAWSRYWCALLAGRFAAA